MTTPSIPKSKNSNSPDQKPCTETQLRKFLQDLPRLLLINAICTLIVTYVMRTHSPLLQSWVFSNCIGFSCYALVRIIQHLFWRTRKPQPFFFFLVCLLITPLGFVAGSTLAAAIFSYPLLSIFSMQWAYFSSFIGLTMVISLISVWSFWNKAKISELAAEAEAEKAKSAAIERQALQAQLQMLQAQIEPHMLFNTLANLQGLIALDPPRAQHMLSQLIVYLRNTLSASRAEKTTLQQEFSLIEAYLELLAIRMGKRLTYTLSLPADLREQTIPPMLLQPLVENAIKHGLEPKINGGNIHVAAENDAHFLYLTVKDTGLGLSAPHAASPETHHAGLGLGNINLRERLQALFGPSAAFTLEANQPEGAIARISIPFIPHTSS